MARNGRSMNNMPNEIIHEILSRLPVKAVLCCKCVSKSWFKVIADPCFIESHLRRSYADANNYHELHRLEDAQRDPADSKIAESVHVTVPEDVVPPSLRSKPDCIVRSFIASYNGLLLFITNFTGPRWIKRNSSVLHLCNPSIKQCREYPNSFYRHHPYHSETLGFGAFPSDSVDIRDYKVVKLSSGLKPESVLEVEVYSFRANSWRLITDSIDPGIKINESGQPQVLLNESLNWLGVRDKRHIVVSFNMADEVYEEMEFPLTDEDSTSDQQHLFLWKLEGCLALFLTYRLRSGGLYWDVFVMKVYGKIDSWVNVCTLDITRELSNLYSSVAVWTAPVWTMPSGELVLKTASSVHLYDHQSERIKKVRDHVRFNKEVRYGFYVESKKVLAGAYVESLITLFSGPDLLEGESVAQPPQLDRKKKKNAERKGQGCSSSSATKKKRSSTVKCSACKYLGHNKRTCLLRDKIPGN